jgi:hypothetical protein
MSSNISSSDNNEITADTKTTETSLGQKLHDLATISVQTDNRLFNLCNAAAREGKYSLNIYFIKNDNLPPEISTKYIFNEDLIADITDWVLKNKLECISKTFKFKKNKYTTEGMRAGFTIKSYEVITISY